MGGDSPDALESSSSVTLEDSSQSETSPGTFTHFALPVSGVNHVDLGTQVLLESVNWRGSSVSDLYLMTTEYQEMERKIERLCAIDELFGILQEFTEEELEDFEESIKRRDFFS